MGLVVTACACMSELTLRCMTTAAEQRSPSEAFPEVLLLTCMPKTCHGRTQVQLVYTDRWQPQPKMMCSFTTGHTSESSWRLLIAFMPVCGWFAAASLLVATTEPTTTYRKQANDKPACCQHKRQDHTNGTSILLVSLLLSPNSVLL